MSWVELDHLLFGIVNGAWSSDILDAVAPWMREAEHWIPLYVVIALFMFWKGRWSGLIAAFFLICTFATTDLVSSRVVKETVKRPRPCHIENQDLKPVVRVRCGSGYSFTSSHATNHFGFALMWALLWARWRFWVMPLGLLWASGISFSQVYVGVHFPLDVIAGAILGMLIAVIWYRVYLLVVPLGLRFFRVRMA